MEFRHVTRSPPTHERTEGRLTSPAQAHGRELKQHSVTPIEMLRTTTASMIAQCLRGLLSLFV